MSTLRDKIREVVHQHTAGLDVSLYDPMIDALVKTIEEPHSDGIDTLGLPFQVVRNLSEQGIETIGQLCQLSMGDLLMFRGLGVLTLLKIRAAVEGVGCSLKPEEGAKNRAWTNEHIRDELRKNGKVKK